MFLQWSFFEMFFFLFFFQLLLISALGAALAFYSRMQKGHAHSLRWIRQSGFLEVVSIVRQSIGRKLPSNISRALMISVTISLLIGVVDISVKAFVNESIQGVNPSQSVSKRIQFVSLTAASGLAGWSISLPPGSSLEDTLVKMVNSTKNIQNQVPDRVYTPRKLSYQVSCTGFNLLAHTRNITLYPHLYSANHGCANVTIAPSDPVFVNYTEAVITRRLDTNSVKVVTPGTYDTISFQESNLGLFTFPLSLVTRVDYQNNKCLLGMQGVNDLAHDAIGITSTPQTAVTKCVFSSGHVTTMSLTSVPYSVPDVESFSKISDSVLQFSTPNSLILNMHDSITDGTLLNLTANTLDTKSVMEIQFSGTKIDLLMCSSRRAGTGGSIYLNCMYNILTTVLSEPQPMLPEIVNLRGANKPFPVPPILSTMITLDHLPTIGANGSSLTFPIKSLLAESASVAQYFAALGQNFFLDWDDGALYTVFDTVDLMKGYEIPVGLFGVVVATMTFCLVLWIAAEVSLDVKSKGSMLWVLTKEMEKHLNRTTPTLVKVDPDLLVMEGFPLVAKKELLDSKEEYEEE